MVRPGFLKFESANHARHCPYKRVGDFAVATIYCSVIINKFTFIFVYFFLQKIDKTNTTNVTLQRLSHNLYLKYYFRICFFF